MKSVGLKMQVYRILLKGELGPSAPLPPKESGEMCIVMSEFKNSTREREGDTKREREKGD